MGLTAAEIYRWGYLTIDGQMILKPGDYSLLDPTAAGESAVYRVTIREEEETSVHIVDQYGVLNPRTGSVCEERFPYIQPMSEGAARARRLGSSFVSVDAVFLNENCQVLAAVDSQEKYLSDVGDFSDGLARVRKVMTLDEMRPHLSEANLTNLAERGWSEGSQTVNNGETFKGYIDQSGAFVIAPRFSSAGDFSDGLAAVGQGPSGKVGFIDKGGSWVIEPTFDYAEGFHNGLSLAFNGHNCGYITKNGAWAIEPQYRNCISADPGHVAVYQQDNTWGTLQHDGTPNTQLAAFEVMNVVSVSQACEGLLPVQVHVDNTYRWGMVDESGTLVVAVSLLNLNTPCLGGGAILAIIAPPEGAPDTADMPGGYDLSWGGYLNAKGEWIYGPALGPWRALDER